MTLSEKLSEIEVHFNYWVGNYSRKELTTNNVRIAAESICKALILNKSGEINGTQIILGKNYTIPTKRFVSKGAELKFSDLIQALTDLSILKSSKSIELQLQLIRDKTNPSSHSKNKSKDQTSPDDLDVCNIAIKSIIKWFYLESLSMTIPATISTALDGNESSDLINFTNEKWHELLAACHDFDARRFQYIFVSPETISESHHIVETFAKIPWRLVIDFDPKSDERDNGLLLNFSRIKGSGTKKTFTIKDKLDFDQDFPHYWFLANGQGHIQPTSDYKSWKGQYKRFLSDELYKAFNKGSRVKSRIVVLLNIPPYYAEDIVEEFNRVDEANLQFILCSENEKYQTLFDKVDNARLINISVTDISNGIYNSLNFENSATNETQILIPHVKDEKKGFVLMS